MSGCLKKKKRSQTGAKVNIYDYPSLACFEKFHFDTKHILDQKALPRQIYRQFKKAGWMPRYQWTLQDARSRFRFLAYSRNLNSEFGLKYLVFCLMYIRFLFNNWRIKIEVGMDQGAENCHGSEKKLNRWNRILEPLKASAYQYHLNGDIRKNLVERSHRTDDSEFYLPRATSFTSKQEFLKEAAGYHHYFNFLRSHQGIAMNDRSPFEVIKDSGLVNPERLIQFPTMILEDHILTLRKTTDILLCLSDLKEVNQEKINHKKLIDVSRKYDFFNDPIAQNVLTPYLW